MATLGNYRNVGDWHYTWPHGHMQPPFNVLEFGAELDPDGLPFVFDSNNANYYSAEDHITGKRAAKYSSNETRTYQQYISPMEPGTGTNGNPGGGGPSGLPMMPFEALQAGSRRYASSSSPPRDPQTTFVPDSRAGTGFVEDGVDWYIGGSVWGDEGLGKSGYPVLSAIPANSSMWCYGSSWGTMWWQRGRDQPIHMEPFFSSVPDGSTYGNNWFNTYERYALSPRLWPIIGSNFGYSAHDFFSLGHRTIGHRDLNGVNPNGLRSPFQNAYWGYSKSAPYASYRTKDGYALQWDWDDVNKGYGLVAGVDAYWSTAFVAGGWVGGEYVQLGWKAPHPSWNGRYYPYDYVAQVSDGQNAYGKAFLPPATSGMLCMKGVGSGSFGVNSADLYDWQRTSSGVLKYSGYPGYNPGKTLWSTSGLMGIVEGCVAHKHLDRTHLEIYFLGEDGNRIIDQGELWFYHPNFGTPQTFTTQCGGRLKTQFLGEGDMPGFFHKSRKLLYDAYGGEATGFEPAGAQSLKSVDFEHPGFVYWRYDGDQKIGGYLIRRHTPKIGFPQGADQNGVHPDAMAESNGWIWHNQYTPYPENAVSPLFFREIMVGVRGVTDYFTGVPEDVSGGFYDRY